MNEITSKVNELEEEMERLLQAQRVCIRYPSSGLSHTKGMALSMIMKNYINEMERDYEELKLKLHNHKVSTSVCV